MSPDDLLSTDRFTKPQGPRPKGPPGMKRFGGPPQKGNFNRGPGNFNKGQQGGRPPFNKGQGQKQFKR